MLSTMVTAKNRQTAPTGYLKRDADRFLPFVEGGVHFDMDSYCKAEVEPMNRECEQIHIIALTEYLGVSIEIAYLDGRYGWVGGWV